MVGMPQNPYEAPGPEPATKRDMREFWAWFKDDGVLWATAVLITFVFWILDYFQALERISEFLADSAYRD